MDNWLRVLLPLYLLIVFATAFVWRTWLVWRRTGVNPYALGGADTPHDFVGKLFRLTLLATAGAVLIYAFAPAGLDWLVVIPWLRAPALQWAGAAVLLLALAWVLMAQAQMGVAWRIGIDAGAAAPLVQTGLFAVSRNPIFLGMLAMLAGLVAVLPTAIMLAIAVLGAALIHVQVRLEEDYLARTHGAAYAAYRARVRRWV